MITKTIDAEKLVKSLDKEAKKFKQSAINYAENKDMARANKQWDKAEGILHVKNIIQSRFLNEF